MPHLPQHSFPSVARAARIASGPRLGGYWHPPERPHTAGGAYPSLEWTATDPLSSNVRLQSRRTPCRSFPRPACGSVHPGTCQCSSCRRSAPPIRRRAHSATRRWPCSTTRGELSGLAHPGQARMQCAPTCRPGCISKSCGSSRTGVTKPLSCTGNKTPRNFQVGTSCISACNKMAVPLESLVRRRRTWPFKCRRRIHPSRALSG